MRIMLQFHTYRIFVVLGMPTGTVVKPLPLQSSLAPELESGSQVQLVVSSTFKNTTSREKEENTVFIPLSS